MRKKHYFRIGILVIFSLVVLRISMIAIPLHYPEITCYDENENTIEIDQKITRRLIVSCQSQLAHNPLNFGDYLGAFFFDKSIEPSVSIVDLRRSGAGYRVVFHGYKDEYYTIFHLSQDFEVILADVKFKVI